MRFADLPVEAGSRQGAPGTHALRNPQDREASFALPDAASRTRGPGGFGVPLHPIPAGHGMHAELVASGMDLAGYCSPGRWAWETDNVLVRLLSGRARVAFGAVDGEMLAEAKQMLVSRIAVFGLLELFDESLLTMAAELGWPRAPYYTKSNEMPGGEPYPPSAQLAVASATTGGTPSCTHSPRPFSSAAHRRSKT